MLCEDMEVVTEMSASSPSSSCCYKETNKKKVFLKPVTTEVVPVQKYPQYPHSTAQRQRYISHNHAGT